LSATQCFQGLRLLFLQLDSNHRHRAGWRLEIWQSAEILGKDCENELTLLSFWLRVSRLLPIYPIV
jgi:hypothetical protein